MILILILAPWLLAVVLVLAACHGASAGEAQLRRLPREPRRARSDRMDRSRLERMDRTRPDRVDVAG
jgi:hypothetical protein